jgi:hypothetical protein
VDEEVTRTEGEFDSRYVQVTRVYETLPGPVVPTKRVNERGDLETINTQTVAPGTQPDPDGLLVTQTQVAQEEVSKGVKTTATVPSHSQLLIKEKKEGLLGETVTTDNIVDPATNPDNLTTSIVASTVQQTSKTKAVKRTTTASGPTSLTQKSQDGKLIGDVTITESVVAPNSDPDTVSASVLASEVKQVDSGKAIKKNTVLNSTPTLTGKRKSGGLMGNTRTVETVVPAGTEADTLNTVILESVVEPINSSISRKATTTQEGPTSLVGGAFKEGLLGETEITESIVTASSQPDALSQTVVSSTIEPIDSAKSKKTTITSTNPTSLTSKSRDGKLLGDVTITELSSEVKQIDRGKAVKRNAVLNSTPTLRGAERRPGLLGSTTTTETVVAAGSAADALTQSIVASTVEPIDATRSRKVTQTSSGPTSLAGKEKKEGLLGETTVTRSIVAAGAEPDQLSQSIIASTVTPIDSAKSEKTTVESTGPTSLSGRENKEGLLGQTTITRSIVAAGAQADALSQSVISSTVTPIDKAKSEKTTVVSSGPTSLAGKKNGPGLLGVQTITESIVQTGSNPDQLSQSVINSDVTPIDSQKSKKTTTASTGPTSLISRALSDSPTGAILATKTNLIVQPNQVPVNNLNTLKYDVNAIDQSKSEAEIVTVDSWPIVHGVEFDELTGIPLPYKETIIPPSEYIGIMSWNNTSYRPLDEYKSLRKSYDVELIQERFKGYLSTIATTTKIQLPDKLISATAYISRDYSEGKNNVDQNEVGGDSYGYTAGGGYKSSGSISADIYFKIEKGFDGHINAEEITFFITEGVYRIVNQTRVGEKITLLSILNDRISGSEIKYWPRIKKTTENILVFTGGKSKDTSVTTSKDVSINGFASSTREDESYDIDANVNSVIIPDTLHKEITVEEEYFGPEIPDDLRVTGGVKPKIIQPTIPDKFPTGRYLLDSSISSYKFGLFKVVALIADITEDFV